MSMKRRRLVLRKKVMANLNKIMKDISMTAKITIVKVTIFPVVIYNC